MSSYNLSYRYLDKIINLSSIDDSVLDSSIGKKIKERGIDGFDQCAFIYVLTQSEPKKIKK